MNRSFLILLTLCLTLLFIIGGIRHFLTPISSTEFLSSLFPFNKLPLFFNYLVLISASSIELLVPLFVIYSLITNTFVKEAKLALCLLMLFLVCTLIFVHNPLYENQLNPFLSNLAILSGLLLLDYHL